MITNSKYAKWICLMAMGYSTLCLADTAATFHYDVKSGKCIDSNGQEGRNSGAGECGVLKDPGAYTDAQGVDATQFNAYYGEYATNVAALHHSILTGAKFTSVKFSRVDFSYSDLSGADVSGATAFSVDLTGVTATGANFSKLTVSSQYQANCPTILTENSNSNAVCVSTYVGNGYYRNQYVTDPFYHVNPVTLNNGNFEFANFSGARLYIMDGRIQITSVKMHGANLTQAIFYHSDIDSSDLSKISAPGAGFNGSIIKNSDLSFSDFRNSDLDSAQLNSTDLSNTLLEGASISNSSLDTIHFLKSDLKKVDFTKTNFTATVFDGSDLTSAILVNSTSSGNENRFVNTNLTSADLSGAKLTTTAFDKSNLSDTKLSGGDFTQSTFVGCNISAAAALGTKFTSANLSDSNLTQGNFSNSDFSSAIITRANFKGSAMSSTTFVSADVSSTVFTGNDLSHANFTSSKAIGADYTGADFRWANFTKADLRGAKMQGANVNMQTVFTGAIYNASTVLPFTADEAKARGMILQN